MILYYRGRSQNVLPPPSSPARLGGAHDSALLRTCDDRLVRANPSTLAVGELQLQPVTAEVQSAKLDPAAEWPIELRFVGVAVSAAHRNGIGGQDTDRVTRLVAPLQFR